MSNNADPNTKDRAKKRYERKREEFLAYAKEKYERNGPNVEYTAVWRAKNADKIKSYRIDNAGLYAFHAAKRRKACKRATPFWADMDAIKAVYIEAQRISEETGISHDVDHIIPLQNNMVCGLHYEVNLQIIPSIQNKKKSNKF